MGLLREIALETEARRGGDAWGMAWIDRNGRLRAHKQPGRLRDVPHVLDVLHGATAVIGHARWATNGGARYAINNHPHPCDGGWLVHNGTVPFHQELASYWEVPVNGYCDSEVLAGLVEVAPAGSLTGRLAWAMMTARQGAPQAALGLWARPGRLLAARSGKPLHWCQADGGVYLASLAEHLPGKAWAVPDDSVHTIKGGHNRREGIHDDGKRVGPHGTGRAGDDRGGEDQAAGEAAAGAGRPGPRGRQRQPADKNGPGLFPGY